MSFNYARAVSGQQSAVSSQRLYQIQLIAPKKSQVLRRTGVPPVLREIPNFSVDVKTDMMLAVGGQLLPEAIAVGAACAERISFFSQCPMPNSPCPMPNSALPNSPIPNFPRNQNKYRGCCFLGRRARLQKSRGELGVFLSANLAVA
ncbi:MAG: hypothetical protein F6J93_26205 [Oscillatoria sp. SIO1A7]|nr:hypothetical protein [Oscillatoria sp. SIO1A7]